MTKTNARTTRNGFKKGDKVQFMMGGRNIHVGIVSSARIDYATVDGMEVHHLYLEAEPADAELGEHEVRS